MKVFISWSGELSHKVALVFRDWLPSVIQTLEPYVSSEDIDKGARWSTDISQELGEANYGILIVTPDNIDAPWLNFEAGAISKSVEKSRVSPFLFGVKRSDVKGPILQFQSTIFAQDDVSKLIHGLNKSCTPPPIEEGRVEKIFDVWWPSLEKELTNLLDKVTNTQGKEETPSTSVSTNNDILEEILELVRYQQKKLSSPEELFPAEYVRFVLEKSNIKSREPIHAGALRDLRDSFRSLDQYVRLVEEKKEEALSLLEIKKLIRDIEAPLEFIVRRSLKSREF